MRGDSQVNIGQGPASGRERLTFSAGATIHVDSGATLNFSGGGLEAEFRALGDLTKTGDGDMTFTRFHDRASIASGSTFSIEGGTVSFGGNTPYNFTGVTIDLSSGAEFRESMSPSALKSNGLQVGGLTGTGTFSGRSGSDADSFNRIGSGDVSSTFDGTLADSDGSNPMTLRKEGTGTFELAGSGTYGGTTSVEEGTFDLSGSYTGEGALDILDAAAMMLSGTGFFGDLTFSGTDGLGVLTIEGLGVLNVLQSNYSIADANTDIGLGNLLAATDVLAVTTFNDGSNDFTQISIGVIPEPSGAMMMVAGLAFLLGARRRRVTSDRR